MKKEELEEFNQILKQYLHHPAVMKMNEYCAHGKISVYQHSLAVAQMAYLLNKKLSLHGNMETLLTGAMLHDFYLYDWHDPVRKMPLFQKHGFTHPETARKNAVRYFDIDQKTQDVIRCHMWPLTIRSVPLSKEAVIVCLVDKICALKETFQRF